MSYLHNTTVLKKMILFHFAQIIVILIIFLIQGPIKVLSTYNVIPGLLVGAVIGSIFIISVMNMNLIKNYRDYSMWLAINFIILYLTYSRENDPHQVVPGSYFFGLNLISIIMFIIFYFAYSRKQDIE